MRLKLFRAARMAEAMAAVRAELGEEAVILGTRRVAEGVEVTAALEPEEPVIIPPVAPAPQAALPAPFAYHGLPCALALKLTVEPLEQALARHLVFADLPDAVARPLLLAGPPGAGKTLTCAKLAARMVLAGHTPLVISCDDQRAGATEQLAAFTRVLGLNLLLAPGAGTLSKALARRVAGQPAVIDTAGCDPFAGDQAETLRGLCLAAQAAVVLVLPAGLDAAEAADCARGFAALGARHLVPTRLDVTRRLGGVLAAADAAGLTLTEAGTGPDVAGGLTVLTPSFLAARLTHPQQSTAGSAPLEAA